MKYGIIGTGWIAESFIKGVRLLTDSKISAVYSRTKEKGIEFADRNSIPNVYTDINELASSNVDAVYIASPNALHYSQSKLMLLAGKHVICEKPVTVAPDEFIENKAIADEKGLIYMEAIMYMHTPIRDKLRDAVSEIGKVSSALFDFSQLSSKYPAFLRGERPNIFNPPLATGCLMDLGIYCVYPAIDLFGMPDSIISDAVFLNTGADGSGSAILRYSDKIVTLTYSKTGQDYKGSCICGDEGTIDIESISKLVNSELISADKSVKTICADMPKEEIMGYEALEFEEFINGKNLDKYCLCSERALQVSQVMQIIRDKSGIKFC